ncbi:MAG TPA: sensor histidine kinase [Gaiellaceae bacterium]|nr:sensor histidine kinase [Gaiellaceae bacterium]
MDAPARSRRHAPRLSTQIVLLQLGIILVTVSAGFAVSFFRERDDLDARAGQQSLAIARTVATIPAIVRGFSAPDPAKVIDPIAERIRRMTGASFVVVASRAGIRYSHPNPKMIGKSLLHDPGEDPTAVLAGKTFVGAQPGSLGRSMRAKVPIRDAAGRVVGLVSVGVLESSVSARLTGDLPILLIPPLLGLLLGGVGSLLLARRIKRQTFGLEPDEIGTLLEQREAMLHGIREGAIATDASGHVTLLNDEAQRLLGLDPSALGRPLDEIVPSGRVRDVFTGRIEGADKVVLVGDRVLVANRMPVEVRGRPIGSVVTLRDRTELEVLLRELDDVRNLADALRAQEHDFSHRLHVIGGLIELGRYDEAVQFINRSSSLHQELATSVVENVGDPILAALLLGKAAAASERGVELRVSVGAALPDELGDERGLVTVLGNLIDNALDAATELGPGGARVDVGIDVEGEDLVITVHDSGPGIDPALSEEIFRDGFTTKVADTSARRGLGLALVTQAVRRRGGQISVESRDGARFTVVLPLGTELPAAPEGALA